MHSTARSELLIHPSVLHAQRVMQIVIRDTRLHYRMYRKEVTHTLLYLAYSRQYLREACCRCADDGV